jgi:hypothetical protein
MAAGNPPSPGQMPAPVAAPHNETVRLSPQCLSHDSSVLCCPLSHHSSMPVLMSPRLRRRIPEWLQAPPSPGHHARTRRLLLTMTVCPFLNACPTMSFPQCFLSHHSSFFLNVCPTIPFLNVCPTIPLSHHSPPFLNACPNVFPSMPGSMFSQCFLSLFKLIHYFRL